MVKLGAITKAPNIRIVKVAKNDAERKNIAEECNAMKRKSPSCLLEAHIVANGERIGVTKGAR